MPGFMKAEPETLVPVLWILEARAWDTLVPVLGLPMLLLRSIEVKLGTSMLGLSLVSMDHGSSVRDLSWARV